MMAPCVLRTIENEMAENRERTVPVAIHKDQKLPVRQLRDVTEAEVLTKPILWFDHGRLHRARQEQHRVDDRGWRGRCDPRPGDEGAQTMSEVRGQSYQDVVYVEPAVRVAAIHFERTIFDNWRDDDLQCSLCGCTDSDCSECWERTGEPCHWASEDPPVCSACAQEAP